MSRSIAAVALSLSAALVAVPSDATSFALPRPVSAPPASDPTAETPATTVLDNEFIPEEANIGDCISALPRPECGSKARGGWRQTLVFVVLIVAMAGIGVRLVFGLRKRAANRAE